MQSQRRAAVVVALVPYVLMIVGVPFVNSARQIWFLPAVGMWILVWVVVTPAFLYAAYRMGWRREREQ
jgi:hypothetical protein